MVALRLHGAIFAASQGVPTLCIAYDPKVDALATQLGAPRVELNHLEEALLAAWQAFQAQRAALEAQLRARICHLRAATTDLLHRVHAFLTTAMGR
ncbi:MAG: polysaccharide pyruvyl transferase family protein, partial [Fimbriimonadales bacterium]